MKRQTVERVVAMALALCVPGLELAAQAGGAPAPTGGQAATLRERRDLERELHELFAKVEKNLRSIDAALGSAAAGETPLDVPPESGIAELLERAQQRGRDVDQQVSRILEIARQIEEQKSSSG